MEKSRIRDKHPGSATLVKILHSLMRIRDGKYSDPGWKIFRSGIRDGKYSGSGSGMENIRVRDPGWNMFGSGMENILIRDGKYSDPGSGMKKNFGSGIWENI
jgi:hypothetical protein